MNDQVMLKRAVVQQVLEALDDAADFRHLIEAAAAAASLRAALAQQDEPQWCSCEPTRCEGMGRCRWQAMKYAPPAQQAERKPLTDEEIVHCLVAAKCVGTVNMSYDAGPYYITRPSRAATWFARAVELAHGITEGQR